MCQIGDIIVIKNYNHNGKKVGRHSFVVIDNESDKIQSLDYDIICNVMSSFKNEEQKKKKLSYPGNYPISHSESDVVNGNDTDGFIKTEQFYYFNKNKTDYIVIGHINPDVFNELMEFIQNLEVDIQDIIDNL